MILILRNTALITLLLCISTEAMAWREYSRKQVVENYYRHKICLDNDGQFANQCISKEVKYFRGTDRNIGIRLWSKFGTSESEFDRKLAEFNIARENYLKYAYQYEKFSESDDFRDVANSTVFQGLIAEDGKTVILPAIYRSVLPLSDKAAIVTAFNQKKYLVMFNDDSPKLTEIPYSYTNWYMIYGGSNSKPVTVVFKLKAEENQLGDTYVVLDELGGAAFTIENVTSNGNGTMAFHEYNNGTIAFPIKNADGVTFSVTVDTQTLQAFGVGPAFDTLNIGYALADYWKDNNFNHGKDISMQKVGTLGSGHGLMSGQTIYQPISEEDGSLAPLNVDGLLGLAPIFLPEIEKVRGWIAVYENQSGRSYRIIGNSHKWTLLRRKPEELLPESVEEYLTKDVEKYYPLFGDIWIGTLADKDYADLFKDVDPKEVPRKNYLVALRFFNNDKSPEAGLSDWTNAYYNMKPEWLVHVASKRTEFARHPDSAEALAAPILLKKARIEWEGIVKNNQWNALPWEEKQAIYAARAESTLRMWADIELESNINKIPYGGDVYKAAMELGGKYLTAYWHQWKRLPKVEDASTICHRFGKQSRECGLVNGWANGVYAQRQEWETQAQQKQLEEIKAQRKFEAAVNQKREWRCTSTNNGAKLCKYY